MGYEAGEAAPEFGWKGRVPLADGSPDATEIDMKIGRVIVESKLTEADFTRRPQDVVTRYRDFDSVFDLPMHCHRRRRTTGAISSCGTFSARRPTDTCSLSCAMPAAPI